MFNDRKQYVINISGKVQLVRLRWAPPRLGLWLGQLKGKFLKPWLENSI